MPHGAHLSPCKIMMVRPELAPPGGSVTCQVLLDEQA